MAELEQILFPDDILESGGLGSCSPKPDTNGLKAIASSSHSLSAPDLLEAGASSGSSPIELQASVCMNMVCKASPTIFV